MKKSLQRCNINSAIKETGHACNNRNSAVEETVEICNNRNSALKETGETCTDRNSAARRICRGSAVRQASLDDI